MKMREKRKITKKLRAVGIGCICLLWASALSVSAADGIVFHVENQEGKAGDTVTVPLEVHSGEEVGGFDIKVFYDPECMEFQELQKGAAISDDGLFGYNHKEDEASVKIIYVVPDTIEADGTIANLVFKLKKDCGDLLPIGMDLEKVIDNTEEGNILDGQVSGTDPAYQAQVSQTPMAAEDAGAKEDDEAGTPEEKEQIEEESKKDEPPAGDGQEKENEQKNAPEDDETEGLKEETGNNDRKLIIAAVVFGTAILAGILILEAKNKKK